MIWNKNKDKDKKDQKPRQKPNKPNKPKVEEPETVRLYGDQLNDGVIQMSFTLPVSAGDKARIAAKDITEKMGFKNVSVIHMEALSDTYTYFVVYAVSEVEIRYKDIEVPKLDYPLYSFDEINQKLNKGLRRKAVVLGACIGSDAHTVGIDAIFNMKGYLGDYGLERYPQFKALNLRAQVDTQALVKQIVETKADAVLISRVVTQRDAHIAELKKFLEDLQQAQGVPAHLIKICGGPRLDHKTALEIGYDAGFGPGTKPGQVASYITEELLKRIGGRPPRGGDREDGGKDGRRSRGGRGRRGRGGRGRGGRRSEKSEAQSAKPAQSAPKSESTDAPKE